MKDVSLTEEHKYLSFKHCIEYSAFKPLHLHMYCTLLRSKSRQYMQGWCERLWFPMAMATNRETTNIHISPPYLRTWWYKTSKLLFTVLFPSLTDSVPSKSPALHTACLPWLGCWLLFLYLSNDPGAPTHEGLLSLFSAYLLIKIWIKEGWTTRSKLSEEGVEAESSQQSQGAHPQQPPVTCFHQWWCGRHTAPSGSTHLRIRLRITFKDKIIIFGFYHKITQTVLNQEFISLLRLIKYIPIKQGLWTIVYSKNLWQRVIAYKYESQWKSPIFNQNPIKIA